MGIPLTLVIIGTSDQILTWERHSCVGWGSRAGFNIELNSCLLILYLFCRNVWISQIQSKGHYLK